MADVLTFDWLLTLMYSFNMCIQVSTFTKASITNGTLKWLLSLMYCFNMSFRLRGKQASQIEHFVSFLMTF